MRNRRDTKDMMREMQRRCDIRDVIPEMQHVKCKMRDAVQMRLPFPRNFNSRLRSKLSSLLSP